VVFLSVVLEVSVLCTMKFIKKVSFYHYLFFALSMLLGCYETTFTDRTSLIIDADTANEVDDLFALVRALHEPSFNLIGITSAQFHTSPLATDSSVFESQNLNKKILQLMNRNDISLPLGSNIPLPNMNTPAESEASDFIIKAAHDIPEGQKLQLVILGPCTNVASAILKDPTIIPKVQVHYIGFWHDVTGNSYNKNEFNSRNDPLAVDVLLNTKGLDFSVMTATTCQHLVFDKTEVDSYLTGKEGLGEYLIDRWETYERWWTDEDPKKKKWIMWDLAIIEALIHPELAEKATFITPKENVERPITIYTEIEVEKMKMDFWKNFPKTP